MPPATTHAKPPPGRRHPGAAGLALALALVLALACETLIVEPIPVFTVAVEPDSVGLDVGAATALDAVLRDQDGGTLRGRQVAWSSTNESVATVSAEGAVSAVGIGLARIRASVEGQSGEADVTVTLAGVAINPAGAQPVLIASLEEGVQLGAVGLDVNSAPVAGVSFTWSSDNAGIASVSSAGVVTSHANGQTTIRAAGGGRQGTRQVQVEQAVASVSIDPGSSMLNALGATRTLTATARDANGFAVAGVAFGWTSLTPDVATVNDAGVVEAVMTGEASIEAATAGVADTAFVTVQQLADTLFIEPQQHIFNALGDQAQFTATAYDAQGNPFTPPSLVWQSLDESIATVDADGLVTAQSVGTATIRAVADGRQDDAVVDVQQQIALIVISPDEATVAALQDTLDFSAQAFDSNGNPIPDIVDFGWFGPDGDVVAIIADARAVAMGNGVGRVIADAGGVQDTALVTVQQVAASLDLDAPGGTLFNALTHSRPFVATARDANGFAIDDAEIDWSSDDPGIASVSEAGVVTAVEPGNAIISAMHGPHQSQLGVTVRQVVQGPGFESVPDTIPMGDVLQLIAVPHDSAGQTIRDPEVTWSSSMPETFTVDPTGLLTAHMIGAGGAGISIPLFPGSPDVVQGALSIFVTPRPEHAIAGMQNGTCALDMHGAAYCWGANIAEALGGELHVTSPVPIGGGHNFHMISGGGIYACGVTAEHRVLCWGGNGFGQLGDGTTEPRSTPTEIAGVSGIDFVQVSASGNHTCALAANGDAYCWGSNVVPRLGTGAGVGVFPTPAPVLGGHSFVSIETGGNHTCAIDDEQRAFCWGSNQLGQLGLGTVGGPDADAPLEVSGGQRFTRLSAATAGMCGVTTLGEAYCWGSNSAGQLGPGIAVGDTTGTPTLVPGFTFADVRTHPFSITTCGLAGDDVYCWGLGSSGQLGNGAWDNTSVPASVSVGAAAAVTVGGTHACALTRGRAVRCWGSFVQGQLGDGQDGYDLLPAAATQLGSNLTEISAGWGGHTCAGTAGSAYRCVGSNGRGQVGDGTPSPFRLTGFEVFGSAMRDIGAGVNFSCVLDTSGMARCWGANSLGQLANNSFDDSPSPTPGAGPFERLSVGSETVCALPDSGLAFCWGRNDAGQVGDGTTEHRSVPSGLAFGLPFRQISVGFLHTCGVTVDDIAYCWGSPSAGRLGNGETSGPPVTSPVAVEGGLLFESVSAGNVATCGITLDSLAFCWGSDGGGMIGGATGVPTPVPTLVPGLPALVSVSVGSTHACGLTAPGDAYCWGLNASGQFGIGTRDGVLPAQQAATGLQFNSIRAGANYTCGVTQASEPYCWGLRGFGTLGNAGVSGSNVPVTAVTGFTLPAVGPAEGGGGGGGGAPLMLLRGTADTPVRGLRGGGEVDELPVW